MLLQEPESFSYTNVPICDIYLCKTDTVNANLALWTFSSQNSWFIFDPSLAQAVINGFEYVVNGGSFSFPWLPNISYWYIF